MQLNADRHVALPKLTSMHDRSAGALSVRRMLLRAHAWYTYKEGYQLQSTYKARDQSAHVIPRTDDVRSL